MRGRRVHPRGANGGRGSSWWSWRDTAVGKTRPRERHGRGRDTAAGKTRPPTHSAWALSSAALMPSSSANVASRSRLISSKRAWCSSVASSTASRSGSSARARCPSWPNRLRNVSTSRWPIDWASTTAGASRCMGTSARRLPDGSSPAALGGLGWGAAAACMAARLPQRLCVAGRGVAWRPTPPTMGTDYTPAMVVAGATVRPGQRPQDVGRIAQGGE